MPNELLSESVRILVAYPVPEQNNDTMPKLLQWLAKNNNQKQPFSSLNYYMLTKLQYGATDITSQYPYDGSSNVQHCTSMELSR